LGVREAANEKSGFSAHSFFFGSSREPDEDGADIGAVPAAGKLFPCNLLLFLMISENRQPTAAAHAKPCRHVR
jgi:hypothetical protein